MQPPREPKAPYVPPKITVMDEKGILKTFQVTSAGYGWWTPTFYDPST